MSHAIDSILGQTYQNFELLIADDGSKDNTWQVINSYPSKKIKAFRFEKNIGAFPRTNSLIKQAKGKYLALMDADDISKPNRLEKQVEFLDRNPEVIVVGSQVELIDINGKIFGQKNVPQQSGSIYKQFGFIHPMVHPSCLIRRSLLPKRENVYHTRFGVNSDYHTFIELLKFGRFANLPDCLLQYRLHGHNTSFKNLKKCFLNTLLIRWQAVREYNYRADFLSILLTLVQVPSILLLPTKLVDSVYPLIRGLHIARDYSRYEKTAPTLRFSYS